MKLPVSRALAPRPDAPSCSRARSKRREKGTTRSREPVASVGQSAAIPGGGQGDIQTLLAALLLLQLGSQSKGNHRKKKHRSQKARLEREKKGAAAKRQALDK